VIFQVVQTYCDHAVSGASLKGFNTPTFDIATFQINSSVVSDQELARKKKLILEASPYTVSAETARLQMKQVQQEIELHAKDFDPVFSRDLGDDDGTG